MAEWTWNRFGEDEDDEDDSGDAQQPWQFGGRDGLICLIDVTKDMFETEKEESSFELCIRCAKSVIQNKIISNNKDLLGVVFMGTEKMKNSSEFKHIYVLHDLDQPGAQRVLELEALIEEDDNDDFAGKFGRSNNYSLSDALWTCSNMFANCSQKLGFKRVLLFTNSDNPHRDNAQLKRQAAAKAEDLYQNGIDVVLMHMNKPGCTFNYAAFYKDILMTDEDEVITTPDASEKFEELLKRVRAKDHKKRALARVPFSFAEGLSMSVGVYNLVRTCFKPPAVKLYKKTNEEIKTVTKSFLTDTGEVLMPQDIKKMQVYADKKICFEQEEIKEIKKFDDPGLKLMGFKPRHCIKKYFHIRPAQFIYPDESTVVGSTTTFTALLTKCLEKDVVAICQMIPRANTPPRFVALIPQEEQLDEHNLQVLPPGFHVIFLPFADDLRKVKLDGTLPRANADQIDKAKEIIRKLMFTFRSSNFENPALQQHYTNVEEMALERDAHDEVTDYTVPDDARMEKRAGQLISDFKDLVFPEGYIPGAKRRAAGTTAAVKKIKVDVEDLDIEKEARDGKLSKLTVAVLKEFIKNAKVKASGSKKADLIEAINEHFGV